MRITNIHNLPEPVYRALAHDDYTRGESSRSVTQLIGAPRLRILKKEHSDQITYDASEMVWAVLGKGVHKMFEDFGVGKWKPEERLYADCKDWNISGQMDLQEHDDGWVTIYDYKITSVWSLIFGKDDYARQLNFYAWLARMNGIKIKAVKIVFILRDWKERDAREKGRDYPQRPIVVEPMPLWTPEQQDDYVVSRVTLHQNAEFDRLVGAELPYCTDEERWKRDTEYAVTKKGNKRAFRVLSDKSEAEKLAAEQSAKASTAKKKVEYVVNVRPGEAIRCERGYCPVAEFCTQFQKELADAGQAANP